MKAYGFNKGGADYIDAEIKKAIEDGCRTAVITGYWEIERAVRLPSNITLILENCHLRMADGVYSNMFLNEHYNTDLGRTLEGADRNINIKGRGMAIIDGGSFNGLTERTANKNGLPSMWNNNPLIFANVDGFSISDLKVINQRWWALTFVFSRNGYVGNIDFCSCDTAIDENGKEYHCLDFDKYEEVLVKNSDGIDLRVGCHDIRIENITGFIEDDTVALTALPGIHETKTLGVEGEPYINNGRLFIKCTKYGSAKIRITAIAGGDNVATDAEMGGSEFTREVSLLSRDSIAENGGWL